ncbi:hypothetical protein AKJ16_DCAP25082 [Drosera capensis]
MVIVLDSLRCQNITMVSGFCAVLSQLMAGQVLENAKTGTIDQTPRIPSDFAMIRVQETGSNKDESFAFLGSEIANWLFSFSHHPRIGEQPKR